MKIFKRITGVFSLIILVLVLTLVLVAELAENRVASMALNRINDGVDATIVVGNIDFSLLSNLPDATVELNKVGIYTTDDTLANLERLYISVEVWPLLQSKFNIKEIAVEGGYLNYKLDSVGASNFDVFLAVPEEQQEDTTSNELFLSLKHLEFRNLFCSFADEQNNINACLYIDEGWTSVFIDNDNTKADFKGAFRANQCKYPQSKLHLMEELKLDVDLSYFNDRLSISNVSVKTDGAQLNAQGEVVLGDEIHTDIRVSSSEFDIRELSKYIPDSLLSAYEIRHFAGIASLQANIKGAYSDSIMPKIDASLQLSDGSIGIGSYPTINHIKVSSSYSNGELMNSQTTKIGLDTLAFSIGESYMFVEALVSNLDKISYRAKARLNIDLKDIHPHLPDETVDNLEGELNFKLSSNGVLPDTYDLQFADYLLQRTEAELHLKNVGASMDSVVTIKALSGLLTYNDKTIKAERVSAGLPDYNLTINNADIDASYKGKLVDFNSLAIDLSHFDISTTQSRLKGTASFSQPDNPNYAIDADASIGLGEFIAFAPDSMIKSMEGIVDVSLKTAGQLNLDSLIDDLMRTIFLKSELKARFNNIGLAMHDENIQLNKLNGSILLHNDSIVVDNVSGDFSDITFDADSTLIRNFYSAFWLNQPDTVMVDGYLNLGDIDYSTLESFMAEETATSSSTEDKSEPVQYCFSAKGKVTAKSFWYGNALFENLSALYNVSDSLYIADQIKFDAFKGSTNSSIRFEVEQNKSVIKFHSDCNGVDINQVLYDFDDFMDYTDEVYISHEQLSGTFSALLDGSFEFYGDSVDLKTAMMRGEYKLEDGRLTEYDIAVEMGKEYDINELSDLQFKTIDTKMFIYQGSIYIPLTNIKSNALDISIFGMQQFDMDCEYYLRLYMKELLRRGKTNRIVKKQSNEKKAKEGDGGTKGMMSIFPFYEIKNGKTKMGIRGNKNTDRRTMTMRVKMQETGLRISFNPNDFNYETGVK